MPGRDRAPADQPRSPRAGAPAEAVARLGERALAESDLQKFFNDVVATAADILDVELRKILELVPGDAEMLLRAGVGWTAEMLGAAHVSTGRESHAGYTLAAGRPVILEDLETETRFPGTQLLRDQGIVSGIAAPIAGRDGRAYGVLCAHTAAAGSSATTTFVPRRGRQRGGGRDPAPATGPAPRVDDPRAAPPLGKPVLAAARLVLADRQELPHRGELVSKYEARVLALANAHRLITEGGWKSTSLNELLNILLAPFWTASRSRARTSFSSPTRPSA